jgi:hypothetical protein
MCVARVLEGKRMGSRGLLRAGRAVRRVVLVLALVVVTVPMGLRSAAAATLVPLPAGLAGSMTVDGSTVSTPQYSVQGSVRDDRSYLGVTLVGVNGGPETWSVIFGAATALVAGKTFVASRLSSDGVAFFDLAYPGSGCNASSSVVTVRAFDVDPSGTLTSLALDFAGVCEDSGTTRTGTLLLGVATSPGGVPEAASIPSATQLTAPTVDLLQPATLTTSVSAPAMPAGRTTDGRIVLVDFSGSLVPTTPAVLRVSGLTSQAPVTVTATSSVITRFVVALTLRAFFLPDDPRVMPSSGATTMSVRPIPLSPQLTATPMIAPADSDVVLTAVVPWYAYGWISFSEQGVGTLYTDWQAGSGVVTWRVTSARAGVHTYSAPYQPIGSGYDSFLAGTSDPTVVAVGNMPVSDQMLITTVSPGSLTLTAPTAPVELGVLTLDSTNTRFVTSGAVTLNPVTITDTRAGQLGYSVTAQADDLTSGSDTINSENLGWTPAIAGPVPQSINAQLGPSVPAGDGLPPRAPTGSVQGLKTARSLVQALADPATGAGSVGTIQVTAALALKAPTTTPTGTYRTTLIITVV